MQLSIDIVNCSICKDSAENSDFLTRCGHHFHEECLIAWLKLRRECPLCRKKISEDSELERVYFYVARSLDKQLTLNYTISQLELLLFEIVDEGQRIDILVKIIEAGVDIDFAFDYVADMTSLIICCHENHLSMAKWFIEHGADVNKFDEYGISAILAASKNGYNEIFMMLYENGADINQKDYMGEGCIHYACEGNSLDILNFILDNNNDVDINIPSNRNMRPIHHPCSNSEDSFDLFKVLIDRGAVYDCVNMDGETPFYLASFTGNLEIMTYLLNLKVNVNLPKNAGQTPLHAACSNGQLEACQLLIDNGAEVNLTDYSGKSALHLAWFHPEIINILLVYGAEVNRKDNCGHTALYYALKVSNPKIETINILLAHGADTNLENENARDRDTLIHFSAANHRSLDLIKFIYELNPENVCKKDNYGNMALHYACKRKYAETSQIFNFLISLAVNINVQNNAGSTPVHYACEADEDQDDCLKKLELLIRYDADINMVNNEGKSPLSIACEQKKGKVINFLIKNGANVKYCTRQLMNYASQNVDLETFQYILDSGADINTQILNDSYAGKSALFIACKNDNLQFFKYLVDNGASMILRDIYGSISLHEACENGAFSIVKFLIEKGIDVNVKNYDNITPLHSSCKTQSLELVEFLVDHGAVIDSKDESGSTPLHEACKKGHLGIAIYLIGKGADINHTDQYGSNSLNHSCYGANLELIRHIFDLGAKFNFKADDESFRRIYDNLELIKFLFENEADVLIHKRFLNEILCEARNNLDIIKFLIGHGVNVNYPYGCSSILNPDWSVDFDTIEYLLQCGSDIFDKNDSNETILHFACRNWYGFEATEFACAAVMNIDVKNDSGSTSLHLASDGCRIENMRILLEHGANVNVRDNSGRTPLHHLCDKLFIDRSFELLCSHGAAIDVIDNYGSTPLHLAANSFCAPPKGFEYLIRNCSNVNAQNNEGLAPVHLASKTTGNLEALLKHGVDINIVDKAGSTPLMLACINGCLKNAKTLIDHGADVNLQNYEGNTAFHLACIRGHMDIVNLLFIHHGTTDSILTEVLQKVCETSSETKNRLQVIRFLLDRGANLNLNDGTGKVLTKKFIKYADLGSISFFRDQGMDLNCTDDSGSTALHYACLNGNLDVVMYLFKLGFEVEINRENSSKTTPLHCAAKSKKRSLALMKFLIDRGADIHAREDTGSTAMHYLCESSDDIAIEMMKFLCRKGAEFDAPNNFGLTPLFFACKAGSDETARFLLYKGAKVNFKNFDGATPIFSACESGSLKCIKLLLFHGAEIDSKNSLGSTPLHYACCLEKLDVVRYLIDFGASINARNNSGSTPVHIMCEKGNFKIIQLLTENGANLRLKNIQGFTPVEVVCAFNL